MFVNMLLVVNYLRRTRDEKLRGKILCYGVNPTRAIRNKKSKWYVSWQEYSQNNFDRYCTGFFLLMDGQLIASMYNESLYSKLFWIDDYWLTAVVGNRVNATLEFYNNIIVLDLFIIKNYFQKLKHFFGIHTNQNLTLMNEIWYNTTNKRPNRRHYNDTIHFETFFTRFRDRNAILYFLYLYLTFSEVKFYFFK